MKCLAHISRLFVDTGGRLYEIQNPFAATTAEANVRWLSKVPAVAHEGIRFDKAGNLYVVDENNSGSIYKYVPTTPGDLSNGQTFVLSVDAFAGNPAVSYNPTDARTGPATWIPITDVNGNGITIADPFEFGFDGGRAAADEVGGTPYDRPEDMVISTFTGDKILYFAATSESAVYSVFLLDGSKAEVKIFVNRDTIDFATGSAVGEALTSPDNLAIDSTGHVYLVEDQGPPKSDIWQAVDADGDDVAEYVGRWLTQGVTGAEPTGLFFDPNNNHRAILAVQHPSSRNDTVF
jgi:secreted PhoX family phosphatase